MSKMAASETVRVRLQFDYPPPATPHCTVFWLLVDLNRCRVVTDLISLIRQRFGFSSGALLGLYLEGGLLPPSESARLVRDNDCLRCAGARGAGGGAARGRACWTFGSRSRGGELARRARAREPEWSSQGWSILPPDASHYRGTRLGVVPMLSQALHAVCMVHVPQTHLLWAALGVRGRKSKQAGRQKCFLSNVWNVPP